MRRESLVIGLVLALVLVPMWYVALHGEPPAEQVEIDPTVSDIRPLAEIVDTPEKLSPSQVGVVVWVALFLLVGVLAGAHRLMNRAVRLDGDASVTPDGDDARAARDPDLLPDAVDIRGRHPRERVDRVHDAFKELASGERLHVVSDRDPSPTGEFLFELCEGSGAPTEVLGAFSVEQRGPETWLLTAEAP